MNMEARRELLHWRMSLKKLLARSLMNLMMKKFPIQELMNAILFLKERPHLSISIKCDIYKVIGIEGEEFEKAKGESDTLAGFLLEQSGRMLQAGEKVQFGEYTFTIEAADKRRIKQIKMTLPAE